MIKNLKLPRRQEKPIGSKPIPLVNQVSDLITFHLRVAALERLHKAQMRRKSGGFAFPVRQEPLLETARAMHSFKSKQLLQMTKKARLETEAQELSSNVCHYTLKL